jgi:hypothetical protein
MRPGRFCLPNPRLKRRATSDDQQIIESGTSMQLSESLVCGKFGSSVSKPVFEAWCISAPYGIAFQETTSARLSRLALYVNPAEGDADLGSSSNT